MAKPENQLATKITFQHSPEATVLIVLSNPLLVVCHGSGLKLSWVTQDTMLHRKIRVLVSQILESIHVREKRGYYLPQGSPEGPLQHCAQ